MKIKTVEVNGKQYAEVNEQGLPIYVHDDGQEIGFDASQAVTKIGQLNAEAKNNREAKQQAETALKAFEGLDAEKAKKALQTVQNLDDKKLIDAGEVEKVKAELTASFKQTYEPQLQAKDKQIEEFQSQLHRELIGGGFARSQYIQDNIAVPVDMVQATFGQNFKIEDGKAVGYDASGNKIYSRKNPGEVADMNEALEILVGGYAHKESILNGNKSQGGGFGGAGGNKLTGPKSLSECKTQDEKVAYLKQHSEQA
ncbi:DUF6651 domain-containing protein [Acinetobacter sp. HY1485]|uniref:DUF6651 domain-containing protein n=1 Tax=Acinetobacter sp. HY1485 TaxID=2970918 RepID=UPI0022B953FC|nr:DUF6651 domain-containing protein [Acinetobacter sp. HY1485]